MKKIKRNRHEKIAYTATCSQNSCPWRQDHLFTYRKTFQLKNECCVELYHRLSGKKQNLFKNPFTFSSPLSAQTERCHRALGARRRPLNTKQILPRGKTFMNYCNQLPAMNSPSFGCQPFTAKHCPYLQ